MPRDGTRWHRGNGYLPSCSAVSVEPPPEVLQRGSSGNAKSDAQASINSGEVVRIQFLDLVGYFGDHADIVPTHEFS